MIGPTCGFVERHIISKADNTVEWGSEPKIDKNSFFVSKISNTILLEKCYAIVL